MIAHKALSTEDTKVSDTRNAFFWLPSLLFPYFFSLIGFKKAMVGSSFTDFKFYRSKTLGATPFVERAFLVDVNPHVNTATVELYADKLSLFFLFRRFRFYRLRRQSGITGHIKHSTVMLPFFTSAVYCVPHRFTRCARIIFDFLQTIRHEILIKGKEKQNLYIS